MPAIHNQIQTYAGVTTGIPVVTTPIAGPGGRGTPTVSLEQSQSTPAANVNAVPGVEAPSSPGFGSPKDDGVSRLTNPSGVNQVLNNATAPSNPITPQPNILDQYASYTYSLSWYMITVKQLGNLINQSGQLNTNQWSLLVQSGGAATQSTSVNTTTVPAASTGTTTYYGPAGTTSSASDTTGRNKYFSLDYYLDDLEITSSLQGHGAQNETTLSFKVTEPNGITLLSNLNNAVKDLYQQGNASWQQAQFVMVIRFYGYDAQGNLVTNAGPSTGIINPTPNSANAVVVKCYPFTITDLHFSAANKAVEYHIIGAPLPYTYPTGSGLGSIPFNLELTGVTVGDILSGQAINSTAAASDGRISTTLPAVTGGLLNPSTATLGLSPYALQVTPLSSLGVTLNNING